MILDSRFLIRFDIIMFSIIVTLLLLIGLLGLVGTLAYGAISAAPWVPMRTKDIARMLAVAQLKSTDLVYELGCGDARLLVAAAQQYRVRAVGFEIALIPYLLAQFRIWRAGVGDKVTVYYKSFWSISLKQADVVFCFLLPGPIDKLSVKFETELPSGARFVTYTFKLHGHEPNVVSRSTPTSVPIYSYRYT